MIVIQEMLNKLKLLRIRYLLILIYISMLFTFIGAYYITNYFFPEHRIFYDLFNIVHVHNLSPSPYYSSGKIAYYQGLYDLAIDDFNQEITINPMNADAYYLLGRAYESYDSPEGKYYSKMVDSYEKYIIFNVRSDQTDYAKLKSAQYYVSQGLKLQNVSYLNRAEKLLKSLNGSDGSVRMALGAIYLERMNYAEAIRQFEKSANLDLGDIAIKYNSLGLAFIRTGAYAKAEKMLEIAVELEPTNKYAHNNLGFVYSQQKKFIRAKVHFDEALKIDPRYLNAKKNLNYIEKEISKRVNSH